jgi:hypothetical protein
MEKNKRKTGRRRPKGEKTRNAGDEGRKRIERIDHFCRVSSTVEHTHTHTLTKGHHNGSSEPEGRGID